MNKLNRKTIYCFLYFFLFFFCRFSWAATVVDALGKTVEIKAPLQKIVVLNADALEALQVLGAEGKVVGVHSGVAQESGMWPNMLKKPQVGKWSDPNIEAIARLRPDVVIHYATTPPFLDEKLKPFGIKVLRLDFFKLQTLEREMAVLGDLLGKQAEARRFSAWHQEILKTVKQRIANATVKKKAYLENYADYSAAGTGSGLHQLCDLAGCVNATASLRGAYPKITPEWVVASNPDIILKMSGKVDGYLLKDANAYNQIRDRLIARPAWKHTKAVQNNKVYVVNSALTSGPRVALAVAYMAHWMYPELMAEFHPDALHQQYMQRFMRVPFQGHYFSDSPRKR